MKTIKIFTVATTMLFSMVTIHAKACEFSFKIASEEVSSYKVGDEVVVAVTVVFTHRNCPDGINNTKFDFTGVKALGATQWKDMGEGKFERKFKLQITEDPKGKHILNATRTCDKDGGAGSVKFPVQ